MQKALSVLPRSEQLNYLLQRHATHSFPVSRDHLLMHVDAAMDHVRAAERHGLALPEVRAYEYGAGWHLIGPLTMWMAGIERQVLVDVVAHMRWELVRDTLNGLEREHDELERRARRELRRVDRRRPTSLGDLRDRFGIDYRAPVDARATGLDATSFDLVTSTFTLEHIPVDDIVKIMRESARLLSAEGLLSCLIDVQDHYAFVDPSISIYNFLRYSDRVWRLVNSPIHFQNRLRACDHGQLVEGADLEIVRWELEPPDAAQRVALERLDLTPRFAESYSFEELLPRAVALTAVHPRARDSI